MQVLQRDFTPQDLRREMESTHIDEVVSVQARQTLEETRFLLDYANTNDWIAGVVGWLPLASPELPAALESFRGERKLKGVRHVVQDETDPAFLDRPEFNAGVEGLLDQDLTYDLLIYGRQLPMTIRFVDRHPKQRFVLDHIAKPMILAERFDDAWEKGIRELAQRPNVSCKFSALVTEVRDPEWTVDLLRPYWDVALSAFGVSRLMFGSDWPVCLLRASYADWVAAVGMLAEDLSDAEQANFWGLNAVREYKLDPL